jgi:hypothetical protein
LLLRHHRGDARAALAILWIEAFVRQRTSAHINEIMTPDLSEEERIALVDLLKRTVEVDRYPLSARVQTLRGILEKLDPRPVRDPLPPPKVYASPRAAAARRRRRG